MKMQLWQVLTIMIAYGAVLATMFAYTVWRNHND